MGQLIYLDQRRSDRSRPTADSRPSFFFDVACPLSYLTAERVERTLGETHWIAVDETSLRGERDRDRAELDALREQAEARARALRLPLVWPDRFPAPSPCALRAAAYACELGAGPRFVLAASRLAFCGGFDLEDPEVLTEAAAAAGVPLDGCLAAAGDARRDEALTATARGLRSRGIGELPAIRIGGQWFESESGLQAACAFLLEPGSLARAAAPLAPVG
jgi:2-hydroxychromene-2-carboxylate isomerase